MIGGAISLALNVGTDHTGKVGYTTYLGLIAISALGAPIALLLSQPAKVIRSDGTPVPYMRQTNFMTEARGIWKLLKSPYLVLLYPVFLAGQFGVTYQGNYLTSKFSLAILIIDPRVASLTNGQPTSPFGQEPWPRSSLRLSGLQPIS